MYSDTDPRLSILAKIFRSIWTVLSRYLMIPRNQRSQENNRESAFDDAPLKNFHYCSSRGNKTGKAGRSRADMHEGASAATRGLLGMPQGAQCPPRWKLRGSARASSSNLGRMPFFSTRLRDAEAELAVGNHDRRANERGCLVTWGIRRSQRESSTTVPSALTSRSGRVEFR